MKRGNFQAGRIWTLEILIQKLYLLVAWTNISHNARQTSKGPFQCGWAEGSWGSWGSLAEDYTHPSDRGQRGLQGNTLLLTDEQWVRRAQWGATLGQGARPPGRASWSSSLGFLRGETGSTAVASRWGLGHPSWAESIGDASGRTAPHMSAISQHVAKTCHAQQPFIMGKHPKNPSRLSQHTEHQNCFISASFHVDGECPHFTQLLLLCYIEFCLIPCLWRIWYLLTSFDVMTPKSFTDNFDFLVRFAPNHISKCWNFSEDRNHCFVWFLILGFFFCCSPTSL